MEVTFSLPAPTGPEAHPLSCAMGTALLSWRQSGPGVVLITLPHLAPKLKKEGNYISTTPLGIYGLLQGEMYL